MPCSVKHCDNEARVWIANVGGRDTFYLCDDHMPETETYVVIETDGRRTDHEIALYARADNCPVCDA